MQVHILSLFPEIFPGSLNASILGKLLQKQPDLLHIHDIKQFAIKDMIDDTPYGGGSGMIMKPDIAHNAIVQLGLEDSFKIYLSPRGHVFNQATANALVKIPKKILILCGRYEGVDQRVLDHWNFHEMSLGNFILCGGEVAALAMLESCFRLLPGVLGNKESIEHESFEYHGLLEHDHYTKPAVWTVDSHNHAVPDVLLSGNHEKIHAFRTAQSYFLTDARNKSKYD